MRHLYLVTFHNGRTARALIDAGLCTPPAAPKED